jgi:putative hydrolase of the HAD superfamily
VPIGAVIFDLWNTLIDWLVDESDVLRGRIAATTDHDPDRFAELWASTYRLRETGPLARAYRAVGVPEDAIEELIEARYALSRRAIVPSDGVVETLAELRRRGLRLAVVSACTEEIAAIWPETPFAGLFDAEVFSATCGYMKPDPEIFLLAAERLGVEPHDCLYVGDGANDELAGAERVGMRAVLIHREGEEPYWPEVRAWTGPRITSIPEVLSLVCDSDS